MAYEFRPDDLDLTAALRRVAQGELARSLAVLEGGVPDAAGIHGLRKRIKKLRGLLRLVRAGFADTSAEIDALRDLAAGLARVRDAEVMLVAHDLVAGGSGAGLRQTLLGRIEAARAGAACDPEVLRAGLAAIEARRHDWRVKGKDSAVIRAGLVRSLSRGAAAMEQANDSRDPEAFHEWRKRIKDLWYQLRLLTPVWPAGMAPWVKLVDDLGEALGLHHDLVLYLAWLEGQPDPEVPALRAAAGIRRAAIEAQVLLDGARLYDADAEDLAQVWVGLWRGWRARGARQNGGAG